MPSIICSKLFFRTRLLDFGTFPLKEFFSIGTAVGLNFTRTFLCRDFTMLGLISIGTCFFELFPRPLFSFFERWGLFEIHFKSRIFISSRFFETLIFFKLLLQIDFFTSLKFFSLKTRKRNATTVRTSHGHKVRCCYFGNTGQHSWKGSHYVFKIEI